MSARIDFTGKRFARLSALHFAGKTARGMALWLCECDCGKETIVTGSNLTRSVTKSCGCFRREDIGNRTRTHGMSHSHPLYSMWKAMRARCSRPTNKDYRHYGARGISVCKRWQNFASFVEDMWPRPEGHSIERVKNHLGYSPANCRWATQAEQTMNTRRNRRLTFRGRTQPLSMWARELGIPRSTLSDRLNKRQMTVAEALCR